VRWFVCNYYVLVQECRDLQLFFLWRLKSLVTIHVVHLHKLEIQNTLPIVRHPLLPLTLSVDKNIRPFPQFSIMKLTKGHSLSRNLRLLQLPNRTTSFD